MIHVADAGAALGIVAAARLADAAAVTHGLTHAERALVAERFAGFVRTAVVVRATQLDAHPFRASDTVVTRGARGIVDHMTMLVVVLMTRILGVAAIFGVAAILFVRVLILEAQQDGVAVLVLTDVAGPVLVATGIGERIARELGRPARGI
jgi:hypothetical protein